MCLSIPGKIVKLDGGESAEVEQKGKRLTIKTSLVPDVKLGDWVLMNADMVTHIITASEAKEINSALKNLSQ